MSQTVAAEPVNMREFQLIMHVEKLNTTNAAPKHCFYLNAVAKHDGCWTAAVYNKSELITIDYHIHFEVFLFTKTLPCRETVPSASLDASLRVELLMRCNCQLTNLSSIHCKFKV